MTGMGSPREFDPGQGLSQVRGSGSDNLREVSGAVCKHLMETQEMVRELATRLGVILPKEPGDINAASPGDTPSALALSMNARSFVIQVNERLKAIIEVI